MSTFDAEDRPVDPMPKCNQSSRQLEFELKSLPSDMCRCQSAKDFLPMQAFKSMMTTTLLLLKSSNTREACVRYRFLKLLPELWQLLVCSPTSRNTEQTCSHEFSFLFTYQLRTKSSVYIPSSKFNCPIGHPTRPYVCRQTKNNRAFHRTNREEYDFARWSGLRKMLKISKNDSCTCRFLSSKTLTLKYS